MLDFSGAQVGLNFNYNREIEDSRFRLENKFCQTISENNHDRVQSAKLFLFSPQQREKHLVRPHVYNFDNPFCLEVLNRSFINNNSLVSNKHLIDEPMINFMVKPANEGHLIDLTTLDYNWTFMLIVDIKTITEHSAYLTNSIDRCISTGFCLDEPVNPITHTPNPNSILKFTHHSKFRMNRNNASSAVLQNVDIIPQELRKTLGSIGTEEIVNLSPYAMQGVDPVNHAVNEFINPNTLTLVESLPGLPYGANYPTHGETKSTKNHLNVLLGTLDEAKNAFETDSVYDQNYGAPTTYGHDLSSIFYQQLKKGKGVTAAGISAWDVKSLSELDNILHKVGIVVNYANCHRTWETYPSYIGGDLNTFNAWIADMIAYLCESGGIISISFTYDSYVGNTYQKEGRWKVDNMDTIHGNNYEYCLNLFKALQRELELSVFAAIKMTRGDFVLSAKYNSFTETLVYLQFYGEEQHQGFYEQPTQLAGLINPNIGFSEYYSGNALQLQNLVNRLDVNF